MESENGVNENDDMGVAKKILSEGGGEEINVPDFIEAVKRIHHLLNNFGKALKSLQYMIMLNVETLRQRYDYLGIENIDLKNLTFQEIASGEMKATEAVLWLNRCLSCVQHIFHMIWKSKNDENTEDFTPFLRKAYKSIFYSYQPWFAHQMFMTLSKYCPLRKKIFHSLKLNKEETDDVLYQRIRSFESTLTAFLSLLSSYYANYALEAQITINEQINPSVQNPFFPEMFENQFHLRLNLG